MLGLIFGLNAGLTSVLPLDMLARFLLPRPPLASGFRCDPAGLMIPAVGLVTVLTIGAGRVLLPEECRFVEDPGVLRGPSFGVLRADILGVLSPPSLASWSVVSMRPSAGLVAAGSGRLSSSMTVPFGEIGSSRPERVPEPREAWWVCSSDAGVAGTCPCAGKLELEFDRLSA
jgi:hypothetical protein